MIMDKYEIYSVTLCIVSVDLCLVLAFFEEITSLWEEYSFDQFVVRRTENPVRPFHEAWLAEEEKRLKGENNVEKRGCPRG